MNKGNSTTTIKELKSKVPDSSLAQYYLGVPRIPIVINSPLRVDKNPSFGLYSVGNNVYYKDFSTGEKGSVYTLLSLLWNCSLQKVVERIEKDSPNIPIADIVTANSPATHHSYKSCIDNIECVVRDWNNDDIEYWKSYGISKKTLEYADVYPISHKIVTIGKDRIYYKADKYAYAFVERKEGKITLKIYQPFNTEGYKWANKHDRSVISLWTKIPKTGETIVICSSLKDALCLWENTHIPAIAIQGEGYTISDRVIKELKERFKNQYILLDNDAPGIKDGVKLAELTGFTNLVLPQFEGGKDISDAFKAMGKTKFINFIKTILKF